MKLIRFFQFSITQILKVTFQRKRGLNFFKMFIEVRFVRTNLAAPRYLHKLHRTFVVILMSVGRFNKQIIYNFTIQQHELRSKIGMFSLFASWVNFPTNTSHAFHVETTWKRAFSRPFNVEYTWCVCRVNVRVEHFKII